MVTRGRSCGPPRWVLQSADGPVCRRRRGSERTRAGAGNAASVPGGAFAQPRSARPCNRWIQTVSADGPTAQYPATPCSRIAYACSVDRQSELNRLVFQIPCRDQDQIPVHQLVALVRRGCPVRELEDGLRGGHAHLSMVPPKTWRLPDHHTPSQQAREQRPPPRIIRNRRYLGGHMRQLGAPVIGSVRMNRGNREASPSINARMSSRSSRNSLADTSK